MVINYEKRKKELIQDNNWLMSIIDKIYINLTKNYNEYCISFHIKEYYNHEDDCIKFSNYGDLTIHGKDKVFNPYKFPRGDGYEFDFLGKIKIEQNQWEIIKKFIIYNNYYIDNKKIDIHSNPYYRIPEYINGSDVPINGRYE